jgi:phage recombination protein Bet
MSDRQLATINPSAAVVELSTNDLEILKATVLKGANEGQLRLFARACKAKGLDPFSREVYGAVNRDGGVELIVGIDGLRHQAEQSGEYAGQELPVYYDRDGNGREIWLGGKNDRPAACKVCVRRRKIRGNQDAMGMITTAADVDTTCAMVVTSEVSRNTPTWDRHFLVMLAVRAEAHALRRAFPRQASGLYLRDEIDEDAGAVTSDAPAVTPTQDQRKQQDTKPTAKQGAWPAPPAANRPRSRPGQDPATQGEETPVADEDGVIEATVITKERLDELAGEPPVVSFEDDDEDLVNATANEGKQIHILKRSLGWTDKDYDEACLEQVGQSGALSLARTKYMIEHMERLAEARGAA